MDPATLVAIGNILLLVADQLGPAFELLARRLQNGEAIDAELLDRLAWEADKAHKKWDAAARHDRKDDSDDGSNT